MTMRRIVRTRKLTSEEAAAYRKIRQQVAEELPKLARAIAGALFPPSSLASCWGN